MSERTSGTSVATQRSPPEPTLREGDNAVVSFTLNGRGILAHIGEIIWQAARRHGVIIPHACLSRAADFRPEGNCRLCMVEVEGFRTLQPSCVLRVSEGLVVSTDSERAERARRLVMELLISDAAIDPESECGRVAAEMGICQSRFPRPAVGPAPDDTHPGMTIDLAKCIHCMRCVQACRDVEVNNVIGMAGRGHWARIIFDFGVPMGQSTCVGCGSCAQACPTGAITFKALRDE
jgi:formate dehydrogenase major subunit